MPTYDDLRCWLKDLTIGAKRIAIHGNSRHAQRHIDIAGRCDQTPYKSYMRPMMTFWDFAQRDATRYDHRSIENLPQVRTRPAGSAHQWRHRR